MSDSITIKCSECGHQNEPERVYCHNCGTKLDRSLLPKPEEKKNYETPEQTRRRMKKMMDVRGSWVKRDFKALVKTLIFAAVVAALLLYWLPPESVPAGKDEPGDYALRDSWNAQMESPQATRLEYKEEDVNRYLKTLKAGESFVQFKGAYVKFSPGVATFMVKREMWGLAMWSSVDYRPAMKSGKLAPQVVGVRYGRLGVDPAATFAHELGVGAVLKTLEKDFGKFDRIQKVEVQEGKLTIETRQ
jgi:hypothetical protein